MATSELVVYLNGTYVPHSEARISIFDLGFLRGDAVYDTLSAWQGWIFKLDAHVARLYDALRAVHIPAPLPPESLKEAIIDTTRRCGLRDAYIKCLITRGELPATERDLRRCRPTTIIFAVPYVWLLPPEVRERGARLRLASVRSLPPPCLDPRIKSTNRLHFALATLETYAAGMDATVLLDLDGHLTEGPGYNVFLVKHGALFTPAAGVLRGITRDTVLELAARHGLAAQEASLTPYDLFAADEVFLTTTAGGILPVTEVEGRPVGEGKPGPLTRRLHDLYWQLRADGWHGTAVFSRSCLTGPAPCSSWASTSAAPLPISSTPTARPRLPSRCLPPRRTPAARPLRPCSGCGPNTAST